MNLFDSDGKPITIREYVERFPFEGAVATDDLPSGHYVSTIWLGMDLKIQPYGPPQIYETLVLGPTRDDRWDGYTSSYATVDGALKGHAEVVTLIALDMIAERRRVRARPRRKMRR